MTPQDELEWKRLHLAWVCRSVCETIDEIVARLVTLQELINSLTAERTSSSADPQPPDDKP
jgi:hypothetical protein